MFMFIAVLVIKVFIFGEDFGAETVCTSIGWTPLAILITGGIAESIAISGDVRREIKEQKSERLFQKKTNLANFSNLYIISCINR